MSTLLHRYVTLTGAIRLIAGTVPRRLSLCVGGTGQPQGNNQ
ncbi:MAG: hypothetical protein V2I25_00940 [Woeseiaceae bacterium]|nr:hypothetical protein [Woeseiaceae bacterium]